MSGRMDVETLGAELTAALAELERSGQTGRLSDERLQEMLAVLVRIYAARTQDRVADGQIALPPFRQGSPVTATDVVVTAAAMLKTQNIAAFELAMWHY